MNTDKFSLLPLRNKPQIRTLLALIIITIQQRLGNVNMYHKIISQRLLSTLGIGGILAANGNALQVSSEKRMDHK